ncbi:uncharacterized protein VICG_01146 [Vittaforma corneae ATCC 50505]|uniref:Post-GPI attachment to proteins factor 3 n=1 Tax=Vittaforma corneae (strain ATCC 50505) TaxID=993615 RepID=L2GMD1_VITCO|nr:uncharacterized protein VICG_01146 [Vittaforma corneae ATCC 50505]ELA41794.1 hypothetical protein VICG_01146 [Vittaforma corneae ATCC 50505]
MQNCEISCRELAEKAIKVNFIDRLVGRTLNEKIDNYCHVDCLKSLRIRNIKRNGRWGFKPVLGMTEAFSSMFAFLSFLLMVSGFKRKIKHKLGTCPMSRLYYMQYYIANAAFLSSFLFHIRETLFTRYADYFTAFASILMGLLVSLNRIVLLKKPKVFKKFQETTIRISIAFFIMHVYKMAFHEFDYTYNKVSCGLLFFASCTCNFTTFLHYREFSHSRQIVYSIGCLLTAGGIEILDISPLFYLFDSHALWHLLMATATPFYLEFISKDIDFQPKMKV